LLRVGTDLFIISSNGIGDLLYHLHHQMLFDDSLALLC
jgi:hypothetical protein